MRGRNLLEVESHFRFGENWADYARLIDSARITHAVSHLERLAGGQLHGKRFLDVGCGSGLHSLAASRLGAEAVVALDIDPVSIATTREVLHIHGQAAGVDVRALSVFDLYSSDLGLFDVVHSWGVLHHTGDMERAIRCTSAMVRPGGELILALYRKTVLCSFWRWEKRWYSRAGRVSQKLARMAFYVFLGLSLLGRGSWPPAYAREYFTKRGMSLGHDVHDWLGGYPYESISSLDVDKLMNAAGFTLKSRWVKSGLLARLGVLGSGCDEYAYIKH